MSEACHPWTVTTRTHYASTRVDLPNVKYKPESQIPGMASISRTDAKLGT